jgi:hypothetical protein
LAPSADGDPLSVFVKKKKKHICEKPWRGMRRDTVRFIGGGAVHREHELDSLEQRNRKAAEVGRHGGRRVVLEHVAEDRKCQEQRAQLGPVFPVNEHGGNCVVIKTPYMRV